MNPERQARNAKRGLIGCAWSCRAVQRGSVRMCVHLCQVPTYLPPA